MVIRGPRRKRHRVEGRPLEPPLGQRLLGQCWGLRLGARRRLPGRHAGAASLIRAYPANAGALLSGPRLGQLEVGEVPGLPDTR